MNTREVAYEDGGILNWHMISRYRGEIYGLCILWIMTFHVTELFPKITPLKHTLGQVIAHGMIGVDVFLFISGVSLYFAMKKRPQANLFDFYKKRLQKIGLIYLIFCVPFFLYMYLIYSKDTDMLFQQLTFTATSHSSFWFLLCIAFCYLLYPLIFYLLEHKNKILLWVLYGFLLGGIFCLYALLPDFFVKYNISLARVPIFLVGALCGPAVYNRKRIPLWFYLLMIVLLLVSTDGLVLVLKKLDWLRHSPTYYLTSRLRMGVQGLGSILFVLPFLPILSKGKMGIFLRYTGAITLELYVTHIIFRRLLFGPFHFQAQSITEKELFLIVMLILSYATSFAYRRIWGWINVKRGSCQSKKE